MNEGCTNLNDQQWNPSCPKGGCRMRDLCPVYNCHFHGNLKRSYMKLLERFDKLERRVMGEMEFVSDGVLPP